MDVPLLEFRNVTVCRGGARVLDGVSLSIPAGQHVAILGPNGSGKSTLIKLVTRELYPLAGTDGAVRVFGRERWHLFDLREHIGIVSNDLMAACTRPVSARDLVTSAFFGSIGLWPHHQVTPAMRERADAALHLMEAGHLAARNVDDLSSGEARRVLVARALAHAPRALVLDEPTNSLDLRACRDLTACLRRLARQGTALILVTHHLPDIVPEIDRVVVLSGGRTRVDGPKPAVLTSSVLTEAFGLPVTVERRDGYYSGWTEPSFVGSS